MDNTLLYLLFVGVAALIVALYLLSLWNRFVVLQNNIRAAGARVGATIDYSRHINRHSHTQTRQARQHSKEMARQGVKRGPRGKRGPAFFVDFNPWPEARGVEVIIPAQQAGYGTRGQAYQERLALIESIRRYNEELMKMPSGFMAQRLFRHRPWQYRYATNKSTSRNKGNRRSSAPGHRNPRKPNNSPSSRRRRRWPRR